MAADLLRADTRKAALANSVDVPVPISVKDGTELPQWQAGADVELHFGPFTPFCSLCGDASDRTRYCVAECSTR
jgi:hypothetical protein